MLFAWENQILLKVGVKTNFEWRKLHRFGKKMTKKDNKTKFMYDSFANKKYW